MAKLNVTQILVVGAKLKGERLNFSNPDVISIFEETKRKQQEVLKLKEISREQLRQVVQL